jgi:sec-independent protein translocase protein TatA
MFGMGIQELLVILFIVLLLFGARRIPEIARNLGKSIHLFKKGLKESEEDSEKNSNEEKKS